MEDLEFTIKNKQILFKFAILFTVASVFVYQIVMLELYLCNILITINEFIIARNAKKHNTYKK
mgnify:CR=1 FL=1